MHDVAEELEHVGSATLIDRLDAFLGYPKFDPHGDPIPDNKGNFEKVNHVQLSALEVSLKGKVIQIGGQSAALLKTLEQKNINIGAEIKILQKSTYDNSLEVSINNQHTAHISKELAENIFVK